MQGAQGLCSVTICLCVHSLTLVLPRCCSALVLAPAYFATRSILDRPPGHLDDTGCGAELFPERYGEHTVA
jgi:hypothetical protein